MAENDAPDTIWIDGKVAEFHRQKHSYGHYYFSDNGTELLKYTRTDLAAPDAARLGKLLDAWELLPNDVKSDLRREFPSFADSITNLFQSVPRKGNNE